MRPALVVMAIILILIPTLSSAGTIINPEEIGGVGVLHVTQIAHQSEDFPLGEIIDGYRVVLDGLAIDGDSSMVVFDAVVTDSTTVYLDGHQDVWRSVQYRNNCLVTINATWQEADHRLVFLNIGWISMYPQIHQRR